MQKFQDVILDKSGNALSGISVTVQTYPGGSLATIYSDNGITTIPNPLTTDANGNYAFYSADGHYQLVISGTGYITTYKYDIILQDIVDAKDANGGYVGLTTYDINFKDATGTYISKLHNVNTSAHLYTFPNADITVAAVSMTGGSRNLIVNGAMQIDQVNNGMLVSPLVDGTYIADNLLYNQNQTGKLSGQNITTSINSLGATNAVRATVLAQYTPLTTDYFIQTFRVEGYNAARLQWGTANARAVSLQFKARASGAGTYSGSIQNAATNRSYPFSFVLAANTDTLIKIENILGDTAGTWTTTNANSINIVFDYGSGTNYKGTANAWAASNLTGVTGATNLVSQVNGATLDITDAQLEDGAFCTQFERKSRADYLCDAQRYYRITSGQVTGEPSAQGYGGAGIVVTTAFSIPVPMRTVPTITQSGSWAITNCSAPTFGNGGTQSYYMLTTVTALGQFYVQPNNSGVVILNARL